MRGLNSVVILLLLAGSLKADEVTLKDGTVHKDLTLVKQTEKVLEFMTLDGRKLSFNKENVLRHEPKPTARDEYKTKKAALKPKDAAGLFDLAKWAKEQGIIRDAKTDLEQVVKLDPNHAGAREALGHKQIEGKWYTESEAKKAEASAVEAEAKAKGWKKWKDLWVSPGEYFRLEKGLVKHESYWVTKEVKKKIDEEKWVFAEGQWVSPKDKEKMDAGSRMYQGRWTPIEELNETFSSIDDPWVLRDRHVELRTNAGHARGLKMLALAEDCYQICAEIFGDPHPDLYGDRGHLAIMVGKGNKDYQALGGKHGQPDRIALHSSDFGAFYAPEALKETAAGKKSETPRGAGCTYDMGDDDWGRVWVGHAVGHAFLDRLAPEMSWDETLMECFAAYVSASHQGKYAPTWWHYKRFLDSKDRPIPTGSSILQKAKRANEAALHQGGLFLHYLRERNPQAFADFFKRAGTTLAEGTKKPGAGAVSGGRDAMSLVRACIGKDGKVVDAEVDTDFAAFLEGYKKSYRPWDKK